MFSSKVAIVTGGSRRIGRHAVLRLAKRAVGSIVTDNSNRAEPDQVAARATKARALTIARQLNAQRIEVAGGVHS